MISNPEHGNRTLFSKGLVDVMDVKLQHGMETLREADPHHDHILRIFLDNEKNKASNDYVTIKEKVGQKLGINVVRETVTGPNRLLLDRIREDNRDPHVRGMIVQMPSGRLRSPRSIARMLK